jgi:hypothetical protein
MVCRERERILREVESVTHCAIDIGESLRIVSEVNWGRRGDIRKRGKWQRDTVRDRTRGRNAESSGEGREQLSARDRLVIDRPEIFGCDEAEADLMVDSDRFNFLSFWNRSVKAILSVCGSFGARHLTTYEIRPPDFPCKSKTSLLYRGNNPRVRRGRLCVLLNSASNGLLLALRYGHAGCIL